MTRWHWQQKPIKTPTHTHTHPLAAEQQGQIQCENTHLCAWRWHSNCGANKKVNFSGPLAGRHSNAHVHTCSSLCLLCNDCLPGGRRQAAVTAHGPRGAGSLLMGGEWRGVLEEKGPPCWRWPGQRERLLLPLIGSLHGGEVHDVSVVRTCPLLTSPLPFLTLLLSFSEESCDGSLIRINGCLILSQFFSFSSWKEIKDSWRSL